MATNERLAALRHVGLSLLEDADVEVRDVQLNKWGDTAKFAFPKNPTDRRFWLSSPVALLDGSNTDLQESVKVAEAGGGGVYAKYLSADEPLWGHADYPVRIEGMFRHQLSGKVSIFKLDDAGNQVYWTLHNGRARYVTVSSGLHAQVDLRILKRITTADIRGAARAPFMWAFAEMLRNVDKTYFQANMATRRMTVMLGIGHGGQPIHHPRNRIHGWREGYLGSEDELDGQAYVKLKSSLKNIGALIGTADPDVDEFVDAVRELHGMPSGESFVGVVLGRWSTRHPDTGIQQCTCGHVEYSGEVTAGRHGQTICRECIDEDRYVMLADLGQYDLASRGYQHDDGDYYSYEQPDYNDGDDASDSGNTPGVRSYNDDVREYLQFDTTIKPSPFGEFLMGIELEVVPKYDRAEAAGDTLRTLGAGFAILKNDGSLSDGGFEIVTAPRGLQEHIKRFREWEPYSTLRAWDAGCCGMHVHISSQAFTQATLGKFIEFYNSRDNDSFIRTIAGRHPCRDSQAESYCQRDGCTPGNPKKTLLDKSADRYYMVNTTNLARQEADRLGLPDHTIGRAQNTIEVRIFRASLKKARLLAQIEFAHASVMFCRWSSMRELNEKHFLKWLKGMAGVYPNLAKWFGVRGNTDAVDLMPAVRAAAEV